MSLNINPNFSGTTTGGQYATMQPYQSTPIAPSVDASQIDKSTNINLPNLQTPALTPISSIPTVSDILGNGTPTPSEQTNKDLQTRYLNAISGAGQKTKFQADAEQAQGLPQFKTQLNDINSQINQLQTETQMKTLTMQNDAIGRGQTTAGLNPLVASVERTNTIKALGLSAIAQTLQGNIALGQQLADKSVEAKFAPVQAEIDYLKQALDINQSNLTREEKKRSDEQKIKLDERQRQLDQQKSDTSVIQTMAVEAAKNGNTLAANKILASSSVKEAIINAGSSLRDPGAYLDIALKQANVIKINAEAAKLANEVANNKPITGEYAGLVNGITSIVGATKAPAAKKALADAIANKDFKTAYANIANSVEDSLTGSTKTRFADARTDINVMSGMRNAIKAYSDAKGDMSFLKGSADSIAKKFGQLATDPKFAALSVQLEREFQAYRNNMTGSAFTPAESKEYASVNPRSNASLDLNLATIDGAISQLTNRVTSTVNSRLPDAQKIYDLATNLSSSTTSNTVNSNGKIWTVGQVYNDGKSNWTIDAQGNWKKQ